MPGGGASNERQYDGSAPEIVPVVTARFRRARPVILVSDEAVQRMMADVRLGTFRVYRAI
jgi:hypothetical protein